MNIEDGLVILGACGISVGTWLIHQPSGYIVAGALLLAAGVLRGIARARDGGSQ